MKKMLSAIIAAVLLMGFTLSFSAWGVWRERVIYLDDGDWTVMADMQTMIERDFGIAARVLVEQTGGEDIRSAAAAYMDDGELAGVKNRLLVLYDAEKNECVAVSEDGISPQFTDAELDRIAGHMRGDDVLIRKIVDTMTDIALIAYEKGAYSESGDDSAVGATMSNYLEYRDGIERRTIQSIMYIAAVSAVLFALLAALCIRIREKLKSLKLALTASAAVCLILAVAATLGFLGRVEKDVNAVNVLSVKTTATPLGRDELIEIGSQNSLTASLTLADMLEDEILEWLYLEDELIYGYYARYTAEELAAQKYELYRDYGRIFTDDELSEIAGENFLLLRSGGRAYDGETLIDVYRHWLLIEDRIYCFVTAADRNENVQYYREIMEMMGLEGDYLKTW